MASTRCRRRRLAALKAAFGISDDVAPDQFLVGLAALTLVTTAAATRRPLLIIVDDTQWLDQESADALGFLARRLYADRVCMLVSMRDSIDERRLFDGLPSLTLAPLSDAASVALLDAAVRVPLADHVRARLLADARGNPLALLEFGRELSPDQLAGAAPAPRAARRRPEARTALPPSGRRRSPRRPSDSCSSPQPSRPATPARSGAPAASSTSTSTPSWPAQAAGLLELGPHIVFRHPLIRSAVYQGASHADRRRAHEALAAASDGERDPDRRAWHRAAAAQLPDDEVAAELERPPSAPGAGEAAPRRRRCSHAPPQLTPDSGERASRLLRAAAADLTAGNAVRAQANLARGAAGPPRPAAPGPSPAARSHDRVHRLVPEHGGRARTARVGEIAVDDARRGASVRAAGRASRPRRGVRRDPDRDPLRRRRARCRPSRSRRSRGRSSFRPGPRRPLPISSSTPSPS